MGCGVEAEDRREPALHDVLPGRCDFNCAKLSIRAALTDRVAYPLAGSAQLRELAIPAACAACLLLN